MRLIDIYNVDMLYSKLSTNSSGSIKTTYKILKLFEAIKKDVTFYRDELGKIIEEYAEKDENGDFVYTNGGQGVKIKEGLLEECELKLDALAEIEVDKPNIEFELDELPSSLSVQELRILMPFIKDEEEKEQD